MGDAGDLGVLRHFLAALTESTVGEGGMVVASRPVEDDGSLANAVSIAWKTGRGAWPEIEIASSTFAGALATRCESLASASGCTLALAVSRFPAADLYLVLGCAGGHRVAVEAFESQVLRPLRPTVAKLGADAVTIDDTLAQVRSHLLVAAPTESIRLLQYRGRSSLLTWVRVILIREALAQLRRDTRLADREQQELETLLRAPQDPELEYLRLRYQAEFRASFAQALATLAPEQRNILRFHLIDRLGIDDIGRLHGIHRSTAARRLDRIRQQLFEETRADLMARLNLASDEFRSLIALVRSQLDYSIGRHLGG